MNKKELEQLADEIVPRLSARVAAQVIEALSGHTPPTAGLPRVFSIEMVVRQYPFVSAGKLQKHCRKGLVRDAVKREGIWQIPEHGLLEYLTGIRIENQRNGRLL